MSIVRVVGVLVGVATACVIVHKVSHRMYAKAIAQHMARERKETEDMTNAWLKDVMAGVVKINTDADTQALILRERKTKP